MFSEDELPRTQQRVAPRAYPCQPSSATCEWICQVFPTKLELVPALCQTEAYSPHGKRWRPRTKVTISRRRAGDNSLLTTMFGSLLQVTDVFPVFCGCSRVQNYPVPKGGWRRPRFFNAYHETQEPHLGSSATISEGEGGGNTSICYGVGVVWTPCRFSQPGVTSGVEGGEAVHRGYFQ